MRPNFNLFTEHQSKVESLNRYVISLRGNIKFYI